MRVRENRPVAGGNPEDCRSGGNDETKCIAQNFDRPSFVTSVA
jgi:hypothetical protein